MLSAILLAAQLDPNRISSEHTVEASMRTLNFSRCFCVALFFLAGSATLSAQQSSPKKQTPPPPSPSARLTIEVTGGDTNVPVENASVYVKTLEEHLIKDKKTEESVKTSAEGVAHVPLPSDKRVLVQVVADGWKPFGRWYDITDPKQVIKIHLDRPPKWY